MPNNITNRLTVIGERKEVERFFDSIKGGRDNEGNPILIDFNRICPRPEVLNIECGSRTDKGLKIFVEFAAESSVVVAADILNPDYKLHNGAVEALLKKYGQLLKDDPDLLKLGEQCYNNIQQYGAPTWYEWSIQNWGTKWNAYSQCKVDDNTIEFQTANSATLRLIANLSEKYPSLSFSYIFADEDWGNNVGEYAFEGGNVIDSYRPKNGSEDAREIAEELLGPQYGEELDDEMEE